MRSCVVATFVAVSWLVGGGAGAAHALTFKFSANNPVWTGAPNRAVSAQVEWVVPAGSTVDSVQIIVYQVTNPGGVRTLSSVGSITLVAPPAIALNSNKALMNGLALAGTYCVQGILKTTTGGVQTTTTIISPDQAL